MKYFILFVSFSLLLSSCGNNIVSQKTQDNLAVKTEDTIEQTTGDEIQNAFLAVIDTSLGKIELELYADIAPLTVTNFIVHAQNDYYDNGIFHRVIDNFMIQGGDPEKTGMGGKSIYGDTFVDEFFDKTQNLPGTIAMANRGKNTNGSQFFINESNNSHLDNKHTVFGRVVQGMDVVDKITQVPMDLQSGKPFEDVIIYSIDIFQEINGERIAYKIQDIDAAKSQAQRQYDTLISQKAEKNKDRIAQNEDIVSVRYHLTLADGTQVDSNLENQTGLQFQIGAGQTISGFNDAIIGMKIGEKKDIVLSPEDAYGPEKIEVQLSDFQMFQDAGYKIAEGEKIETAGGVIEILEINQDQVFIKNPHELAGKELHFSVELEAFIQ